MVVPSMEIVQKPQETVSKHPNDNSGGNQALFIDTNSTFDNHFDLMGERETSFFKSTYGLLISRQGLGGKRSRTEVDIST